MTVQDGDVLRVTPIFKYENPADLFVNNWYLRVASGGPVPDDDVAAALGAWLEYVYETLIDEQSTTYQYVAYDWANVTQDTVFPAELWPNYTAGIVVGDPLPSNLCGYAFGRTQFSKVYSKKYFNGMPESHNTAGGQLDSALLAAIATAVARGYGQTALLPGVPVDGGIVTSLHGFVTPSVLVVPVTWRALRRRIIGVGG